MFQLRRIDRDGTASVVTKGLYRVVAMPGGKVMAELLEKLEAKAMVDTVNACNPDGERWAKMVAYSAARKAIGGGA